MATLEHLKRELKSAAAAIEPSQAAFKHPLTDEQYSAGFNTFTQCSGQNAYNDFIIPQLSLLLDQLLATRKSISILEVGPGPRSILERMPAHIRRRIGRYSAFEPNVLFASRLEESLLCSASDQRTHHPLPCLETPLDIRRLSFPSEDATSSGNQDEFDVVLFCHSTYGMRCKHEAIKLALGMLRDQSGKEMVVLFHRDGTLKLDGLVCHQIVTFPSGIVHVRDDDNILDSFADFIAGFAIDDPDIVKIVHDKYQEVCRSLGSRRKENLGYLSFSSPETMVTFRKEAMNLSALTAQVLVVSGESKIKNREARMRHPAVVVRPENIRQVQHCVRWALDNEVDLSIVGGSHSDNCAWSHVVAIDMSAFRDLHVLPTGFEDGSASTPAPLVVVGAGCTSGGIISATLEAGLTVPLGSRPSVGAGLWLQGGIGHLSRLHGLSSDAVVGAVVVSVADGKIMHIGCVPSRHRPKGSVRPVNDGEMLWMLEGAVTNLGVVISVTFKAYEAPMYSYRKWIVALDDDLEVARNLKEFDESIACKLPNHCSADAYFFWEGDKLNLGITVFEVSTTKHAVEESAVSSEDLTAMLGPGGPSKIIDSIGLFQAEMYMSGMHGGHAGGKTSSFKRCLFLKQIGSPEVSRALIAAIGSRPSSLCYLHLLHGGGVISEIAADSTAFGCRDWDFACVVTGIWPRDQDGSAMAGAAIDWVCNVVQRLLPVSSGVYGADLGPDPRDVDLASKAFGANQPLLARLKSLYDPESVLAYACPLKSLLKDPQVIFLVTGESGAGKDFCADIWAFKLPTLSKHVGRVRVASISEAIKHEYANATGADMERLLSDRAYKEQHRPALTAYFLDRVRRQRSYPQDNFVKLLHENTDVMCCS